MYLCTYVKNRVTCQIYVMEICPNKIRGGMITFQAVWYALPDMEILDTS